MWGVCGQNIYYHVAAILILFNLISNRKKKLNFDFLILGVVGEGRGSVGKIFASM